MPPLLQIGIDQAYKSLGGGVAPYVAFLVLAAAGFVGALAWIEKREKKLTEELRTQFKADYDPQIASLTTRLSVVEAALNSARPLAADALIEAARLPNAEKLTDILRRLVATIS